MRGTVSSTRNGGCALIYRGSKQSSLTGDLRAEDVCCARNSRNDCAASTVSGFRIRFCYVVRAVRRISQRAEVERRIVTSLFPIINTTG